MASGHGNTVAAWVGVSIMLLAFIVGSVGILIDDWTVFGASVGLFFVGPIVGLVLQKLGFGQAR